MISSQENREDSDIPLVADSDSEEEAACAPQPPVAAWKQAAEVRPASELSPCWRTLVTRAPEQELDSTPLAADSDSDSDDEAESAPQAPSAPPQKATKTIPQLPPQPQLPQLNLGGSLAEQLASCKERMQVLEKLLSQSQWQNQVADSQNQALRKQVDQFSWEIQKLRTRERIKKVDAEVQTETYATWSHSDYTAYSQEYYYPSTDVPVNTVPANLESKCSVTAAADQFVTGTSVHTNTSTVKNGQKVEDPDAGRVQNSKEEKAVSLAEMLRVTAEAVVSQTGFTFDEATGLYYDHNTGYYYDSENQLYYDANSGIYYSCDAETGNYVFHSRVDLPASQTTPQVNKNVFHSRVNRPASQTTPQVNKDVFHSHVNRPASQTTPQVNKDVFPSHVDLPASQTTPQVNKEPNRMLKRQKSWDEDDYENELILDENTGIYSYRHPVTGLMMFHSHVDDQAATYQGNNKIKVKKQRPESSGAPANEVQEIKTEGKTAKQKKRTKSRTVLFNAVKEEEPVFENGISDGKTLSTESLTYVAESGSDAESSEDEGEIVTSDVEKECSDDNMSADMEIGTDSEDAENEG